MLELIRFTDISRDHKDDSSIVVHSKKLIDEIQVLSTKILEFFLKKLVIREKMILDFNILAVSMIYNSVEKIPETLQEITDRFSDYLNNQIYSEDNMKRAISYMRVYQTAQAIHIFMYERDREQKIRTEVLCLDEFKKIIEILYLNPGITEKELCEEMNLSKEDVNSQLRYLEQKDLCVIRKTGNRVFYVLTKNGVDLYHCYQQKESFHLSEREWDSWRIRLLKSYLEELEKNNIKSFDIKRIVQGISDMSDREVTMVLRKFRRLDTAKIKAKRSLDIPSEGIFINSENNFELENVRVISPRLELNPLYSNFEKRTIKRKMYKSEFLCK